MTAPKWRNWQTRRIQNPLPHFRTDEVADTYAIASPTPPYSPDSWNQEQTTDAALDALIRSWPTLPEAMRVGIGAMVNATISWEI